MRVKEEESSYCQNSAACQRSLTCRDLKESLLRMPLKFILGLSCSCFVPVIHNICWDCSCFSVETLVWLKLASLEEPRLGWLG